MFIVNTLQVIFYENALSQSYIVYSPLILILYPIYPTKEYSFLFRQSIFLHFVANYF